MSTIILPSSPADVCAFIKSQRQRLCITRDVLAIFSDLDQSTIHRIETGDRYPRTNVLDRILDALAVGHEYLPCPEIGHRARCSDELADHLHTMRGYYGLTYTDLSRMIGVRHRQSVYEFEHQGAWQLTTLYRIGEAFRLNSLEIRR